MIVQKAVQVGSTGVSSNKGSLPHTFGSHELMQEPLAAGQGRMEQLQVQPLLDHHYRTDPGTSYQGIKAHFLAKLVHAGADDSVPTQEAGHVYVADLAITAVAAKSQSTSNGLWAESKVFRMFAATTATSRSAKPLKHQSRCKGSATLLRL